MTLWVFVQKEEGIGLVCEAICSGIFNDLGSGSNVDICVITKVLEKSSLLYMNFSFFFMTYSFFLTCFSHGNFYL